MQVKRVLKVIVAIILLASVVYNFSAYVCYVNSDRAIYATNKFELNEFAVKQVSTRATKGEGTSTTVQLPESLASVFFVAWRRDDFMYFQLPDHQLSGRKFFVYSKHADNIASDVAKFHTFHRLEVLDNNWVVILVSQ